jgi:hypothetical protein
MVAQMSARSATLAAEAVSKCWEHASAIGSAVPRRRSKPARPRDRDTRAPNRPLQGPFPSGRDRCRAASRSLSAACSSSSALAAALIFSASSGIGPASRARHTAGVQRGRA